MDNAQIRKFSMDLFEDYDILDFELDGEDVVMRIAPKRLQPKSISEIINGILKPFTNHEFGFPS